MYSDQETNKILAVRFIDADTLTALQPYKINKQENSSSNDQASIPYEQNPNQLITLYEVTNEMRHLKV